MDVDFGNHPILAWDSFPGFIPVTMRQTVSLYRQYRKPVSVWHSALHPLLVSRGSTAVGHCIILQHFRCCWKREIYCSAWWYGHTVQSCRTEGGRCWNQNTPSLCQSPGGNQDNLVPRTLHSIFVSWWLKMLHWSQPRCISDLNSQRHLGLYRICSTFYGAEYCCIITLY